jgi:hypothetical protein
LAVLPAVLSRSMRQPFAFAYFSITTLNLLRIFRRCRDRAV